MVEIILILHNCASLASLKHTLHAWTVIWRPSKMTVLLDIIYNVCGETNMWLNLK